MQKPQAHTITKLQKITSYKAVTLVYSGIAKAISIQIYACINKVHISSSYINYSAKRIMSVPLLIKRADFANWIMLLFYKVTNVNIAMHCFAISKINIRKQKS